MLNAQAGHEPQEKSARSVFEAFMKPPFFPVPPKIFLADLTYEDFEPGDELDMGDGVIIQTAPLNHPGGAVGYRINYQGKSICYITDTEHVPDKPDETILHLIRNTDVMIYDATFSDENSVKNKSPTRTTNRNSGPSRSLVLPSESSHSGFFGPRFF